MLTGAVSSNLSSQNCLGMSQSVKKHQKLWEMEHMWMFVDAFMAETPTNRVLMSVHPETQVEIV